MARIILKYIKSSKPILAFLVLSTLLFCSCAGVQGNAHSHNDEPNYFMSVWKIISAADGDRCAMTPSCSAYAAESIRNYGFFEGYLMTCDRLIRCGRDELRLSPVIKAGDDNLCLDPPNENKIR